MKLLWLIPYYISWHYTYGSINLLKIWRNFIWFIWSFFSIRILLRTLFSPFQRLRENYKGSGLDIEKLLSSLIINILMRMVGFILRIILITIGLMSFISVVTLGLVVFIVWLVLPFLVIFIFILGLRAMFNSNHL